MDFLKSLNHTKNPLIRGVVALVTLFVAWQIGTALVK